MDRRDYLILTHIANKNINLQYKITLTYVFSKYLEPDIIELILINSNFHMFKKNISLYKIDRYNFKLLCIKHDKIKWYKYLYYEA
jgi:hypothetical protein